MIVYATAPSLSPQTSQLLFLALLTCLMSPQLAVHSSPCLVCHLRLLQPCGLNHGKRKPGPSSIGATSSRTSKAALLRHIFSHFCIHSNNTTTTTRPLACISSVPAPVLTMSLSSCFLVFDCLARSIQSCPAPDQRTSHLANSPRIAHWDTHVLPFAQAGTVTPVLLRPSPTRPCPPRSWTLLWSRSNPALSRMQC